MAGKIGVDLGGTKIAIGIVTGNGEIVEKRVIPTHAEEGSEAVISRLSEVIHQLISKNTSLNINGIGVAAAGQIDPNSGEIILGPNLQWHHVPLAAQLKEKHQLPVNVVNDVRASTWAEWRFGAGKGYNDLVCLFVGTGVGGGLISDGRLISGSSNCAGELGHITVAVGGRTCHCGGKGCLEAYSGGRSIAEIAREKLGAITDPNILNHWPKGEKLLMLSASDVYKYSLEGDRMAKQVIDDALAALTAGVVTIVNAFNPACIVLGGGIIEAYPDWISSIDVRVRSLALGTATKNLKFAKASLGTDSGIIGAASLLK
jgi:glucokinase